MQTMTSKGTAPTSAALGSAVPTSTVLDNAVLNSAVLNPAGLGTTGVEVLGTHAAHLAALASAAEDHEDRALSENTRRAYTHDWAQWVAWCSMFGAEPLPADPEMVRLYVTELASVQDQHGLPRFRAVTIGRAVSAISHFNAAPSWRAKAMQCWTRARATPWRRNVGATKRSLRCQTRARPTLMKVG